MRHCARKRPALPGAATGLFIASVFFLQLAPSAGTAVPRGDPGSRKHFTRSPQEHVILADCTSPSRGLLSQMAYYPGSVRDKPQDIAVVPTTDGQYSLWVDSTTSALFTTSGVTFTATLGPRVADGEYAGKGNNGYGDFSCWASYEKDVYQWGNVSCSMVYDCDHQEAPEGAQSSSAETSSGPAAPTSTSQEADTRGRLSIGAMVGASVGAGVGTVMVVLGIFFLWRHMRDKKKARALAEEPAEVKESQVAASSQTPAWPASPPPQELDAQWRGTEIHAYSKEGELDGNPRSELSTVKQSAHASDTHSPNGPDVTGVPYSPDSFDNSSSSDGAGSGLGGEAPQRPG